MASFFVIIILFVALPLGFYLWVKRQISVAAPLPRAEQPRQVSVADSLMEDEQAKDEDPFAKRGVNEANRVKTNVQNISAALKMHASSKEPLQQPAESEGRIKLNNPTEARKAFLYSEIFIRKYN